MSFPIHSNVGIYVVSFANILTKYGENGIYVFGHSLDITDGDILQEIIGTPDTDTTIFYKDKQQQADQIANLSKVLGQDELLNRTFSTSPTIIFKQQAEMVAR